MIICAFRLYPLLYPMSCFTLLISCFFDAYSSLGVVDVIFVEEAGDGFHVMSMILCMFHLFMIERPGSRVMMLDFDLGQRCPHSICLFSGLSI